MVFSIFVVFSRVLPVSLDIFKIILTLSFGYVYMYIIYFYFFLYMFHIFYKAKNGLVLIFVMCPIKHFWDGFRLILELLCSIQKGFV